MAGAWWRSRDHNVVVEDARSGLGEGRKGSNHKEGRVGRSMLGEGIRVRVRVRVEGYGYSSG